MERTDEVIYQRAAEEHIRRPPLWHDDEVDSVRVRTHVSIFFNQCTVLKVGAHLQQIPSVLVMSKNPC